jgi:hypothetical protein
MICGFVLLDGEEPLPRSLEHRIGLSVADRQNGFCGGIFSEGDAAKWIDRHAWWLIEPITEKSTNESSSAA